MRSLHRRRLSKRLASPIAAIERDRGWKSSAAIAPSFRRRRGGATDRLRECGEFIARSSKARERMRWQFVVRSAQVKTG